MITEEFLADLGRVSYWSMAVCIFLLILAETVWPVKPYVRERERVLHVGRNFALWLSAMLIGNVFFAIFLLDLQNRLTDTYFGPFHWFDTPLWFDVVVGILLLDLGEYIFHRLSHSVRWMWLFHAVHHSDTHLDATSALRFHPGEIIVNITWKICFCFLLGLPLWLVGARGLLMATASMIQHSNITWPASLDAALRQVFITPGLHRCHHSPDPVENNTNFGEIFSFWDRLFGTYLEADETPRVVSGLPRLTEDKWQSFPGMIYTPLGARKLDSL